MPGKYLTKGEVVSGGLSGARKRFNAWLPAELHNCITERAKKNKISFNRQLVLILQRGTRLRP